MGRSFKQRKLKKTRRVKVKKTGTTSKKSDKKKVKIWEYFLWAGAVILAIAFIVFAAKLGSVTPDIEPSPTAVSSPTVVETTE